MKRVAGYTMLLALVASACSESPTTPNQKENPLIERTSTPEAKASYATSLGLTLNSANSATTSDKANLVALPPFWQTSFGTDLHMSDDQSTFVAFNFPFTFYGNTYTGAWVGSNGYITFQGSETDCCSIVFPSPSRRPMIAAIYGDWLPPSGGAVLFNVIGQAPRRRLVVTWAGVPEYAAHAGYNTFQLQILESLNVILLSYNGLSTPGFNWTGNPMRVGISNGQFFQFGGYPPLVQLAVGSQIPALNGHTLCLINLGGTYRSWSDLVCSIFVL